MNIRTIRNLLRTLGMAVLLTLASCSTQPSGPAFTGVTKPTGERAVVYVFRPDGFAGRGGAQTVYLDKDKIAELGNEGFIRVPMAPGEHVLWSTYYDAWEYLIPVHIKLTVAAGDVKFFRLTISQPNPPVPVFVPRFTEVQPQLAEVELMSSREEQERYFGPRE